jgi:hypothetical protein
VGAELQSVAGVGFHVHLQASSAMQTYDAHKSTNEVRQGSGRLMNFRVLIWSILGVIVAFGLIYLVFYAMAPPPNTTTGV